MLADVSLKHATEKVFRAVVNLAVDRAPNGAAQAQSQIVKAFGPHGAWSTLKVPP